MEKIKDSNELSISSSELCGGDNNEKIFNDNIFTNDVKEILNSDFYGLTTAIESIDNFLILGNRKLIYVLLLVN